MSGVHAFIKRHPILFFYLLAFVLSWAAIFVVIAMDGGLPADKQRVQALLPVAIFSMLGGPSVAGLISIALVDGRAGFRELGRRLRMWRAGWRWWMIAILLFPALLLAIWLTLSLFSPVYLPGMITRDDRWARIAMGLSSAIVTGFCEELGWTGFALPRLRQRYSVFQAGLIIGVLHGLWHIVPIAIWPALAYAGELSPAVYVTIRSISFLIGALVAFRVLVVWVYENTQSLPLIMIMHTGLTAANIIYEPEAIGGMSLYVADLVAILTQWLLVAIIVWRNRSMLTVPKSTAPRPA